MLKSLNDLFRLFLLIPLIGLSSCDSVQQIIPPAAFANTVGSSKPDMQASEIKTAFKEELNNLPLGKILYNPSDKMRVGKKEIVEVRITENLTDDFKKNLKGRGIPNVEELKVSGSMSVSLTGENFEIKRLNPSEEQIIDKPYTEWTFNIIPQKSGIQTLRLIATLKIRTKYGEEKKDWPSLDKKIQVLINLAFTLKSFIKVYWPILLVPANINWFLKLLRKLRKKSQSIPS